MIHNLVITSGAAAAVPDDAEVKYKTELLFSCLCPLLFARRFKNACHKRYHHSPATRVHHVVLTRDISESMCVCIPVSKRRREVTFVEQF